VIVQYYIPSAIFKVTPIKTKGDKDKATPLTLRKNSDFFTYEIEQALLSRDIDVAVHSAKDLEENMPADLVIAAMTKSISKLDCLVSRGNLTLDELPAGSVVGTSSENRRQGILRYRSDLVIKDIRGNIDERLVQLDNDDFQAIVIAHAALIRLGFVDHIAQIIPFSIIEPHPLQGRIAIQIHRDRKDLLEVFRSIDER